MVISQEPHKEFLEPNAKLFHQNVNIFYQMNFIYNTKAFDH